MRRYGDIIQEKTYVTFYMDTFICAVAVDGGGWVGGTKDQVLMQACRFFEKSYAILIGGPVSKRLPAAKFASPAIYVSSNYPPFLIFEGQRILA